MTKRDASSLTPDERKRIVKAWNMEGCDMWDVFAVLLDVHTDTVRLVLSEEGE